MKGWSLRMHVVRMLMLLILCTELTPSTAKSSEISNSKVNLEKLISILQPKLPKAEAVSIARGLIKASADKKCEIPLLVLLSVAFKESTFDRYAHNDITKDYGIMQINDKTIERLNIDKSRLIKDLHYSFKVGCYLLTENKQKYSKRRPYWLGIYNSGTKLSKARVVHNAKKYDNDLKKIIRMVEQKTLESASR